MRESACFSRLEWWKKITESEQKRKTLTIWGITDHRSWISLLVWLASQGEEIVGFFFNSKLLLPIKCLLQNDSLIQADNNWLSKSSEAPAACYLLIHLYCTRRKNGRDFAGDITGRWETETAVNQTQSILGANGSELVSKNLHLCTNKKNKTHPHSSEKSLFLLSQTPKKNQLGVGRGAEMIIWFTGTFVWETLTFALFVVVNYLVRLRKKKLFKRNGYILQVKMFHWVEEFKLGFVFANQLVHSATYWADVSTLGCLNITNVKPPCPVRGWNNCASCENTIIRQANNMCV